jgi:hypothetical protein
MEFKICFIKVVHVLFLTGHPVLHEKTILVGITIFVADYGCPAKRQQGRRKGATASSRRKKCFLAY